MPMPGFISQGFILKSLGNACNDGSLPLTGSLSIRDAFLADLKDEKQPLLAIFAKYGVVKEQPEKEHLEKDWFNEKEGWWRKAQPVEPIIRHALIKALDVANRDPDSGVNRKSPLPVDAYWICASEGYSAHVDVAVCWSEYQVTFLIASPEPPEYLPLHILKAKEPIWVIKRVDADEASSPDKEDLLLEVDKKGKAESKIIAERMKTFDNRLMRFGKAVREIR